MITAEKALELLDDLDDYARMTVGVDASGPREGLKKFIQAHAEIVALLKNEAAQPTVDPTEDDFIPYEAFGGNIDDAFSGGESYGRASVAQEILEKLGESW